MAPLKKVIVRWIDSSFEGYGWEDMDKLLEPDLNCTSMGFLVKKTRKYIQLAPSLNGTEDAFYEVGGLFTIPRSAITSIEPLDVVE